MTRTAAAGRAIGIFDSGVGGLTVLKRIAQRLPHEHLCYLGDTARVPYGTKSADTVIRYARSCAAKLTERGIKLLVVACNTASAYALDTLAAELPMPVLGVVEPGAREAVRCSKNGRVGVIGTAGTVASGAYTRAIAALNEDIRVYSKACPLFVPLAEEGWVRGEIPRSVAKTYLAELAASRIDTLVLGCTHYPLLRGPIAPRGRTGSAAGGQRPRNGQGGREGVARLGHAATGFHPGKAHFPGKRFACELCQGGRAILGSSPDGCGMGGCADGLRQLSGAPGWE